MKPECSTWKIWVGGEVEGDTDIGSQTVFIRDFTISIEEFEKSKEGLMDSMTAKGTIRRIWFCKEFQNWGLIRAIMPFFKTVCIEVTHKSYDHLPRDLKASCTIYLKLDHMMKDGDFVCVGPAYQDEAFRIGTGHKVKPADYTKDRRVR